MKREIEGYTASSTRVPASTLLPRPLTLSERTGPVELAHKWNVGALDLCRSSENGPRALGQLISVTGRVTDEDGSPVSDVVMELCQANAAGKYVHEVDDHIALSIPTLSAR